MGLLGDLFADDRDNVELAQDYKTVYDNVSKQERDDEEMAWKEKFADLKSRGMSPSAALIEQTSDIGGGGTGGIIPGTGQGSGYQAPDALARWKSQIDGMMQSNNPVLQKKGLDMLSSWQDRLTTPERLNMPAAIQEYQYAAQQGYQGSFQDWKALQKASGTTVNVGGGGDLQERVKESDLKNYTFPEGVTPPVAPTYQELRNMGAKYTPNIGADAAGRLGMMESAIAMFPLLDSVVIPEGGAINERALDGAFYIGLDPTPGHSLSSKGLELGGYTPAEVQQSKQVAQAFEMGFQAITRTETGAAMPQEEIQNTKARFQPLPTDPPKVKKQRYLAYKHFIESAANRMDPSVQRNGSAQQLTDEINRLVTESLERFGVGEKGESDDATDDAPKTDVYNGVDLNTVDFGD